MFAEPEQFVTLIIQYNYPCFPPFIYPYLIHSIFVPLSNIHLQHHYNYNQFISIRGYREAPAYMYTYALV